MKWTLLILLIYTEFHAIFAHVLKTPPETLTGDTRGTSTSSSTSSSSWPSQAANRSRCLHRFFFELQMAIMIINHRLTID